MKIKDKKINRKASRKLALQAIRAEWAKDFMEATLRWKQARELCTIESEALCEKRAKLCNYLASNLDLQVCKKTDDLLMNYYA